MDALLIALMRTTVLLAAVSLLVWLLLKTTRVSSPRIQRIACCLVLLQGWVFMQMPLEIPYYEPPQRQQEELTTVVDVRLSPYTKTVLPVAHTATPLPAAEPEDNISWTALFVGIWISGIIFYALCLGARYAIFLRRLPPGRACDEEWNIQWERLLTKRGIKRHIPLRITTRSGPALCRLTSGYELLIPYRFWKELSSTARLAILEHELAHYRRRDGLKSLAVRLLALPQWFNPLAWFMVRRFDECAEWACDRLAVGNDSRRKSEYAEALLRLGRFVGGHPSFSPAARGRGLSARVCRLVSNCPMEDSVMKRISVIGSVMLLAMLCLIRVELVAKEPPPETPDVEKSMSKTVDKSDETKSPGIILEYSPPTEANMAKLPPYVIEPPDVVQIKVSDKNGSLLIEGAYLIGPDGTINLRKYGTVKIAGNTIHQAIKILVRHFFDKIETPIVRIGITARNSKNYYIILKDTGKGDNVLRLPYTDKETVRDALKQIQEKLQGKTVRISRPIAGQSNFAFDVDVQAVLDGSAEHNYQLFPGDRIFVDKITEKKNLVTAPKKDDSKSALPVLGMGVSAGVDSPRSHLVCYSVEDIITRLREERNLSWSEAHVFLEGLLKPRVTNTERYTKHLTEIKRLSWYYSSLKFRRIAIGERKAPRVNDLCHEVITRRKPCVQGRIVS